MFVRPKIWLMNDLFEKLIKKKFFQKLENEPVYNKIRKKEMHEFIILLNPIYCRYWKIPFSSLISMTHSYINLVFLFTHSSNYFLFYRENHQQKRGYTYRYWDKIYSFPYLIYEYIFFSWPISLEFSSFCSSIFSTEFCVFLFLNIFVCFYFLFFHLCFFVSFRFFLIIFVSSEKRIRRGKKIPIVNEE